MNAKSRGYQKIATAAQALGLDFAGKIVLDIGSSTGGFSQYALEHGAKKVIAVEKGTNQMTAPLRFDPALKLHEKTDIFSFKLNDSTQTSPVPNLNSPTVPKSLPTSASNSPTAIKIDLILADVSFISLTKVLMYAKINLSCPQTRFLVMLKPQFEARPDQLNKGIVKNSKTRRDIIKTFETWLKQNNFHIISKLDNTLPGRFGNQERFYYLSLNR